MSEHQSEVESLKREAQAQCEGCRLSWRLDGWQHREPMPITCTAQRLRQRLRDIAAAAKEVGREARQKHRCAVCGSGFTSALALTMHKRDSHTGTSAIRFKRTGRTIAFLDVHIGSVFFVHGRYWTRTDFDAGSEIVGSDARGSCCNFIIDGTMKPKRGPFMYPADELCETCAEVEEVTVEGNDRK